MPGADQANMAWSNYMASQQGAQQAYQQTIHDDGGMLTGAAQRDAANMRNINSILNWQRYSDADQQLAAQKAQDEAQLYQTLVGNLGQQASAGVSPEVALAQLQAILAGPGGYGSDLNAPLSKVVQSYYPEGAAVSPLYTSQQNSTLRAVVTPLVFQAYTNAYKAGSNEMTGTDVGRPGYGYPELLHDVTQLLIKSHPELLQDPQAIADIVGQVHQQSNGVYGPGGTQALSGDIGSSSGPQPQPDQGGGGGLGNAAAGYAGTAFKYGPMLPFTELGWLDKLIGDPLGLHK